jgi:hypothetical protein
MPAKLYEAMVTLTAKVPAELREHLRAEAKDRGISLNAWVFRRLSAPIHSEPAAEGVGSVPVSAGTMTIGGKTQKVAAPETSIEDLQRRGVIHVVKSPSAEAIAERDRRHLSPGATPERTKVREGFEVAEDECTHPKEARRVLTYMTTCTACGRRVL